MPKKIIIGSFIIVLLDQLSKYIVEGFFKYTRIELIPNFFAIDLTYNSGGAFSIFSNHPTLVLIVSVISLFIVSQISKEIPEGLLKNISFSLIYGGIIGNLIDRLFIKSVRDFLDFHIMNHHFPTFNIADIAIVIGMLLLIIMIFLKKEVSYNADLNSEGTT